MGLGMDIIIIIIIIFFNTCLFLLVREVLENLCISVENWLRALLNVTYHSFSGLGVGGQRGGVGVVLTLVAGCWLT